MFCLAGQGSIQAGGPEATIIRKTMEVGERSVFFAMSMWVLVGFDGFSSS